MRIRFEDSDPFGHLNNGRYVDYFMNAREDQMREVYQRDIYEHMRQSGKAWVVASSQIAYLREAKYNEEVIIRTNLRWFTASDLLTEGQMLDPETGALKSVVWMRFAYLDVRKGTKATHEPELMDFYKTIAIVGEGKEDLFFEQRVKELRALASASSGA